ncbi:hypothetical protein TGAMA5MH_10357 [Trichoderma gamsii]|uniref:Uncharacterized protein n=1 Tax=Trichoderma gamsii TaxID=398673 RepID=A0A2K0SWT0_9HYPO|nr:hypothetical protein TGAMA5MH_10357 [Trichoderma gamsii]
MHPTSEQSQAPAPSSQKIKGKQRSALARHRAETIACYITDVFLRGELLGEGVEPGWVLGGQQSQTIAFGKWVTFQHFFMEGWAGFVERQSHDPFWANNQPAFHAYDYGANIEIKVNPSIEKLEREVRSRVYADQEDDSEESDTEAAADAGDKSPASGLDAGNGAGDGAGNDASNDAAFYEWVNAGSRNESTRGSSTGHSAPTAQISLAERPGSLVSMDLDTVAAHAKPLSLREAEEVEEGEAAEATTEAAERAWEDEERVTRDGEESDSSLFVLDDDGPGEQDGLYSDGLKQLRRALEEKYDIDNIDYVSYALAVDVHCAAADQSGSAVCLLADRNQVMKEFYGSNYTFYPLGFHPAYGNFTSDSPPAFLDHNLFTVMKSNMSHQNQGADVLSFGFFQGYSNLKRSFRHREDDLLASQGSATAALTIPATEAARTAQWRAKQQRLLRRVRGEQTPENPAASTPFARERQRVEASMAENEFAYRFEQVISVDAARLVRERRNFGSILLPIFQLMRLFLKEKQLYASILRKFPPQVFPGVLTAFARTIELAIGEMDRRFREGGSKGLGLASSEGVAALDRLGHFCFTGDPRVLPSKVFGLLGTMEGLRTQGWPHISPRMLNLQKGKEILNLARWPRGKDGRLSLMHIPALAYHYGPAVAASRHSQLWFSELGGQRIEGLGGVTTFLGQVFRDVWVPETVAFMSHQLHRSLSQSARGRSGAASGEVEAVPKAAAALETWEQGDAPFSWSHYQRLSHHMLAVTNRPTLDDKSKVSNMIRRDYARQLYLALVEDGKGTKGAPKTRAVSSVHATWPSLIKAAIEDASTSKIPAEQWIGGIATALLSTGIEWVPGSYAGKLSHLWAVRFVGSAPTMMMTSTPTSRPTNLKRAAMEAEARMEANLSGPKRVKRQRIDFGCKIPFERVPDLVQAGFNEVRRFNEDQKVLDHYATAYCCLESCLGDPLCDVMLMLVLTMAASTETPDVKVNSTIFSVGSRKEPSLLAANMVTKMLWFLRPSAFPWEKANDKRGYRVGDMAKKIESLSYVAEHKGVNNRILHALGWIEVHGKRPTPRISESKLRSAEDLLKLRKELLDQMKNAQSFICKEADHKRIQDNPVKLLKTLVCEDIEEQEEGNNQPLPDYLAQSQDAAATELQRDEIAGRISLKSVWR